MSTPDSVWMVVPDSVVSTSGGGGGAPTAVIPALTSQRFHQPPINRHAPNRPTAITATPAAVVIRHAPDFDVSPSGML